MSYVVPSSHSSQYGGAIPAKSTARGIRTLCIKHGLASPGIPSSRLSAFSLSLVCFALTLTWVPFVFRIDVSVQTDVVYKLPEYRVSTFLAPRRSPAAPLIESTSSRIDPRHRPSDYISPPSRPLFHFFLPQVVTTAGGGFSFGASVDQGRSPSPCQLQAWEFHHHLPLPQLLVNVLVLTPLLQTFPRDPSHADPFAYQQN